MNGRMSRAALTLGLLALASSAKALAPAGSVADSKHNLSRQGPGGIRSRDETRVCVFCHRPHGASKEGPLWARQVTRQQIEVQGSRRPGDGPERRFLSTRNSSRLCLSCHDGTLALTPPGHSQSRGPSPRARALLGTDDDRLPRGAPTNLGTNLVGSHPIDLNYEEARQKRAPGARSALRPASAVAQDRDVRLDGEGRIQCVTCHDPHSDAHYESSGVHFFRKPSLSEACVVCHEM